MWIQGIRLDLARLVVLLSSILAAGIALGGGSPGGGDVVGVPGVPCGLEFFDAVGMGGAEIVFLADVVFEVVELGFSDVARLDELPIAVADGHLLAESPEEGFVRGGRFIAGEVGEEIDAVEFGL